MGTDIADMTVLVGAEALVTVSTLENVDSVMAAIVGAAGLSGEFGALQATVDEFGDASAKSIKAFEARVESMAFRADVQLQRFRNSFVENFARPCLKSIVELTERLGGADVIVTKAIVTITKIVTAYVAFKVSVIATNAVLSLNQTHT